MSWISMIFSALRKKIKLTKAMMTKITLLNPLRLLTTSASDPLLHVTLLGVPSSALNALLRDAA
jgi:hypothetical protein